MFTVEQIAEVCHESNRILTKHVADVPVQPSWAESPEEMRTSSVRGVQFALDNPAASAEQQHEAWAKDKLADGWKYGAVKDAAAKTHPALIPYADLPEGTRRKDALFRAVVAALR
jgi:RyR domain